MKDLFQFLQEQPSALSYSVFFWLRCLLLLAGFFVIFSGVLNAVKKRNSGVLWNTKQKIIANASTVMSKASLLVLGIIIGYASRDHQLVKRTITYKNVLIAAKVASDDFWVVPEFMEKQHIQLCPSSIVDWREKEMLSDWTFEQQQGCKRVISYHEKPQGETNASIQMR